MTEAPAVVGPAKALLRERFRTQPDVSVFAPGRGEFLGVWADVFGCPMLTCALPWGCALSVSQGNNHLVRCVSDKFSYEVGFMVNERSPKGLDWARFLYYAIQTLKEDGRHIENGFNVAVSSDLPMGAGVSSSSALTTGFILALNELCHLELTPIQVADVACRAEWKETKGGNKDQMTIANAKAGHLFYLRSPMLCDGSNYDYAQTETDHIPWPDEYALCYIDTGTQRTKEDYAGCMRSKNQALGAFRKIQKIGGHSIYEAADINEGDAMICLDHKYITSAEFDRLMHPISDRLRVERMRNRLVSASLDGEVVNASVFELLDEAHLSLMRYGISSVVLDYAHMLAKAEGALGACQIGAGFAGCIVAVVRANSAESFKCRIRTRYSQVLNKPFADINVLICYPSEAARVITD